VSVISANVSLVEHERAELVTRVAFAHAEPGGSGLHYGSEFVTDG
jgi:hypothetical protein